MEVNDAEDDGQFNKKKPRKMVINDDDDGDDLSESDKAIKMDVVNTCSEQEQVITGNGEMDLQEDSSENDESVCSLNKDDEESVTELRQSLDSEETPLRLTGDLYDDENSGDGDVDLDTAAGADYDSADDKNFDQSIDPHVLAKLKKMKGASKKPRQQKPRKCKPSKVDMLELRSESQRLIRESCISLPYHKPAHKSLGDFMQRVYKKQAYRQLPATCDIEKAQIIQDKIVELPILSFQNSFSSKNDNFMSMDLKDSVSGRSSHCSIQDNAATEKDIFALSEHLLSDISDPACGGLPDLDCCQSSCGLQINGGHVTQQNLHTLSCQNSVSISTSDKLSCTYSYGLSTQSKLKLDKTVVCVGTRDCDSVKMSVPALFGKSSGQFQNNDIVSSLCEEHNKSLACDQDNCTSNNLQSQSCSAGVYKDDLFSNESGDTLSNETFHNKASGQICCDSFVDNGEPILEVNSSHNCDSLKEQATGIDVSCLQKSTEVSLNVEDRDTIHDSPSSAHDISVSFKSAREQALAELDKRGVVPMLRPGDDHFVELFDYGQEAEKSQTVTKYGGVHELMDRFAKQVTQKKEKVSCDMKISIVEKVASNDGNVEKYKLNTLNYKTTTQPPDRAADGSQGSHVMKLQALKQALEVGMKEKRSAAYERRQQLYRIENEVGFDCEEDDLLDDEEEAEMTEQSDTDDDGSDNVNMDFIKNNKKRKSKYFIQDEADEDDGDDDDGGAVDSSSDDDFGIIKHPHQCTEKIDGDVPCNDDLFQDVDQLNLRLDVSDEDGERDTVEGNLHPGGSGLVDADGVKDSSFEVMTPMRLLMQESQSSNVCPSSQPIEDSQDLYNDGEFDRCHSILQSNMFNEDNQKPYGLSLSSATAENPNKHRLNWLSDSTSVSIPLSESQDACSNDSFYKLSSQAMSFRNTVGKGDNVPGYAFESTGVSMDTCDNATDLSQWPSKKGRKRRIVIEDSSDEQTNDAGTGSLRIRCNEDVSEDPDSEAHEEDLFSDEDREGITSPPIDDKPAFTSFKNKRDLLKQFVETEAELSGSDAESDESLDVAEEDDYLEMEEGDGDVSLSEEQLREQVGRVHMKQMLADDHLKLMQYKEMYLPDGDLHTDGSGRFRRFHWKHSGVENSQQDLFQAGSDEEKECAEDNDDEKTWRVQRYERERFLQSQEEDVSTDGDGNSQLMKFGHLFLKQQHGTDSSSNYNTKKVLGSLDTHEMAVHSTPAGGFPGGVQFAKPITPRGSFLSRSKEKLAKMAAHTKAFAPAACSRPTRNFVFSINSANKRVGADGNDNNISVGHEKTADARHTAAQRPSSQKMCIKPKPQPCNSIFKLLDK